MITQIHEPLQVPQVLDDNFQFLYDFSLKLNPSNRIQVSIKPHYPGRGSSGTDSLDISTNNNIDEIARQLYLDGDVQSAIALVRKPPTPIKRSAAGGGTWSAWHLSQTASVSKFIFFSKFSLIAVTFVWSVLDAPALPNTKKFTATARLRILDAAGALEKSGYLPQDFYFFTGTLPGSSDLACQFFARNSRPFLDALKGWLRKDYGIYLTFNCWEWQMRQKFHLIPALHLHLVICTKDETLGSLLPQLLKDKWFSLLDYYSEKYAVNLYEKHLKLWTDSEKAAGYGFWSKEELERLANRVNNPLETCKTVRCEKSPAAYLSKYVGKGSLSGDEDFQARFKNNNISLYYPSSWWSISDAIRELIEQNTKQVGFRNTLDECFRAYTLLEEILEDGEWQLLKLALPVFIPVWAVESRLYRNFYCNSENYEQCKDVLDIFQGGSSGDTSKSFQSASYSAASISLNDILPAYFEKPENYRLKEQLIYSIPFYRRISTDGILGVDWSDPVVYSIAKKIYLTPIDYPEPLTLEERIRLRDERARIRKIQWDKDEPLRYEAWLESHQDYSLVFENYIPAWKLDLFPHHPLQMRIMCAVHSIEY